MRYLAVAAALLVTVPRLGADEPTAARVLEKVKTTYPAKSVAEGARLLGGVLESCHAVGAGTAAELAAARKGDHVRFLFPKPLRVEVGGRTLEASEVVYADGVLWLACGPRVVRCTKYTHLQMEPFRKWYEQTLPADPPRP
ncbi:hypothetical protein GobsT_12100 [Gemmata obscuriglobus]|uniref:Uncharacterized protein n=1 Tax=Gemmata obscuriglobus TaxID=114 RepID=A0A2Z3HFY6_9BACT|nr:hypothetical protein [Gemmata obscuriglobus]AWM40320.1 hypothetical protein C1280_27160 [Gemmata obscuriglobus]QEG26470.1 hypothetical protein GobsT_12100 [Gemmata obscuriglobus]VTS01698.1 unnamed protein product [Gemmata obscuriglobus UQM 2246]